MSKYTYRKGRESRLLYMTGYVEGQLARNNEALVSRTWYKTKFNIGPDTVRKDVKGLSAFYPQIVWTK